MRKLRKRLKLLINRAYELGLPEKDTTIARDFLEYNEYQLCLDQIVSYLYEFDVLIDKEFYNLVEEISVLIEIPQSEYEHLKNLLPQ